MSKDKTFPELYLYDALECIQRARETEHTTNDQDAKLDLVYDIIKKLADDMV